MLQKYIRVADPSCFQGSDPDLVFFLVTVGSGSGLIHDGRIWVSYFRDGRILVNSPRIRNPEIYNIIFIYYIVIYRAYRVISAGEIFKFFFKEVKLSIAMQLTNNRRTTYILCICPRSHIVLVLHKMGQDDFLDI